MTPTRSKPVILSIDDQHPVLELIREFLSPQYEVHTCSDAREAVARVLTIKPDLILLDVDMPRMSGLEVAQAIRQAVQDPNLIIIFLTGDVHPDTMQHALRSGGNDFLPKPFRMHELLSRVEFRLGQKQASPEIRCGNLTLDPTQLLAKIATGPGKNREFRLTHRAVLALCALMRSEGRLLSREELVNQAWESEQVSDRSVDLQICRLRKLLEGWDHEVESVYGKGYRVVLKVEEKAA